MEALLSIAKLFSSSPTVTHKSEDFAEARLVAAVKKFTAPQVSQIDAAVQPFSARDVVDIDVTINDVDPITFHSSEPNSATEFASDIAAVMDVAGANPNVQVAVTLRKQLIQNTLTILSLPLVIEGLVNLSLKDTLLRFSKLLEANTFLRFECFDNSSEFNTESLFFRKPASSTHVETSARNRATLFSKRNEVCHFENAAEVRVIPEDFWLQNRSDDAAANDFFDKLCLGSCLMFLADITQFENANRLFFKLNGYKAITGGFERTSAPANLASEFFKVYQWVYEAGIVADKIGLARNLLSLHSRRGNLLDLDADVFTSIRSGYLIYLKQNVKQYIEIKNKLSDFVTELSKKAAQLGQSLGDTLAKNFVAFVSFFLSVVIVKTISDKNFTGAFTPQIATIAYTILIASLVHLIASLWMLNREIRQLDKTYNVTRDRYADLLDANDLDKAFNKNSEFSLLMTNIKFKRNLFGVAWGIYIVLFASLVCLLTAPETVSSFAAKSQTNTVTLDNAEFARFLATMQRAFTNTITTNIVTNVTVTNMVTNVTVPNVTVTNVPIIKTNSQNATPTDAPLP